MKSIRILFLMLAAAVCAFPLSAESDGGWAVGGAAQLVLPQGGSDCRRKAGGSVRVARYLTDSLALEGEAAWLEDSVGLSLRTLWHLHGWDEYDKLFGFSRFDPFFTFGAKGWIGSSGAVGPSAGFGAFWYLTDDWALRADADATLGLDGEVGMAYSIGVGVQYSF